MSFRFWIYVPLALAHFVAGVLLAFVKQDNAFALFQLIAGLLVVGLALLDEHANTFVND